MASRRLRLRRNLAHQNSTRRQESSWLLSTLMSQMGQKRRLKRQSSALRLSCESARTSREKFLVIAATLLICSDAKACDLSLVSPAHSVLRTPVRVTASLTGDILTAHFSVAAPSLNAKRVLRKNEYPYQFDVVELFLTTSPSGFPYFEFEVSPYNQIFQVRIASSKQHEEGVDLGLTSTADVKAGGGAWSAELKIPLKPLGWDGDPDHVRGNFYAILGQGGQRSFWSAFLPKAQKANFHQPQYFRPLLPCS